ncbi:hypothetical protein UPYG_G00022880, partial [Umbra pygmaea]
FWCYSCLPAVCSYPCSWLPAAQEPRTASLQALTKSQDLSGTTCAWHSRNLSAWLAPCEDEMSRFSLVENPSSTKKDFYNLCCW